MFKTKKHPIIDLIESQNQLSDIQLFIKHTLATYRYSIEDFDIEKLKRYLVKHANSVEIIHDETAPILAIRYSDTKHLFVYIDKDSDKFIYLREFVKVLIELYESKRSYQYSRCQAQDLVLLANTVIEEYAARFGLSIVLDVLSEYDIKNTDDSKWVAGAAIVSVIHKSGMYISFIDRTAPHNNTVQS